MNNANCDQLIDYLNGMLSEEEKKEFEEHLTGCEECREIVDVTGELPYLAEAVEPPAEMKARILANVFEEEEPAAAPEPKAVPTAAPKKAPKRNWLTPLLAAILLLSLLGNVYALMQNSGPQEAEEEEPAFRSVALQPSDMFGGNATAAIIKEEGALNIVVQAEQLEELSGTEVYQVWLLKEGQTVPTGAFTPNAAGEGAAYYTMEENTEGWDTIAITLEPESGNETPAGEIVLSSEI